MKGLDYPVRIQSLELSKIHRYHSSYKIQEKGRFYRVD